MKPGNESLLFSWWARLVAMDPKTKIGLWLFGEVGGGFSELYLTLRPGWGLVLKSASCFHHRWEWCCPLSGGLTEDRRFALAVEHHWYSTSSPASAAEGCAQGQCEQEEQRQDVSPKPLRGFPQTPCLWEWKMAEKPWGYTWLHHRQSHTSPLTDRVEK